MGRKRFYDAARDLLREADPEPAPTRRRLSIASLLSSPQSCAACYEVVLNGAFECHNCPSVYCQSCLITYARSALKDKGLLPLRCAREQCRAPVALSALRGLLREEEVTRLSRFQWERVGGKGGDEGLERLMGRMGWRRCPDCGMGVERTGGCPHIVCVCGGEFCYECGGAWRGGGVGCRRKCGLQGERGFEELREEVWQRIVVLLQSVREHLERRGRMQQRPPLMGDESYKMRVGSLVHSHTGLEETEREVV